MFRRLQYVLVAVATVFFMTTSANATMSVLGSVETTSNQGGWKVVTQGNKAYVAAHARGLYIVDTSDPANPTVVAQDLYREGGVLPEMEPYDLAISGNYLYVPGRAYLSPTVDVLSILDVSDPANPTEVGRTLLQSWDPWGIKVRGNYAYITDFYDGFEIVDVSDPANPTPVSYIASPTSGMLWDVALSGDYAYLGVDGGDTDLLIYDISDPAKPVLAGANKWDEFLGLEAIAVSGQYAYLATRDGMKVIDISNPSSPQDLGSVLNLGKSYDVVVDGDHAFLASDYEFKVIDISDPNNPTLLESLDLFPGVYTYISGVALNGSVAMFASHTDGLVTVDVTGYADADADTSTLEVVLDVDPGVCPNSINSQRNGPLSVAILGSASVDVSQIDVSSITVKGVGAVTSLIDDIADPSDCAKAKADGFDDLVLKFDNQAVAEKLLGDVGVLNAYGNLKAEFGGTAIHGADDIVIASPDVLWGATATASSEWTSTEWSAMQATGIPNAANCSDVISAWSPDDYSTPEWLEIGFATPTKAIGVQIHESYNPGFVYQIDLIDVDGVYHTVWTGTDETTCATSWFNLSLPKATSYQVQGVRIYTQMDDWEEVDAVGLVPKGGSFYTP